MDNQTDKDWIDFVRSNLSGEPFALTLANRLEQRAHDLATTETVLQEVIAEVFGVEEGVTEKTASDAIEEIRRLRRELSELQAAKGPVNLLNEYEVPDPDVTSMVDNALEAPFRALLEAAKAKGIRLREISWMAQDALAVIGSEAIMQSTLDKLSSKRVK